MYTVFRYSTETAHDPFAGWGRVPLPRRLQELADAKRQAQPHGGRWVLHRMTMQFWLGTQIKPTSPSRAVCLWILCSNLIFCTAFICRAQPYILFPSAFFRMTNAMENDTQRLPSARAFFKPVSNLVVIEVRARQFFNFFSDLGKLLLFWS